MTTDLFGTSPAISSSSPAPKHRGRRAGSIGIAAGAAVALFIGGLGATASAAPPNGATQGNVVVGAGLTLSGLSASFTLTGIPGSLQSGEVTYNVETNNVTGYQVTAVGVVSGTPDVTAAFLPGNTTANTDSIPMSTLTVGDASTGLPEYLPMSSANVANVVHTQSGRSIDGGDDLTTGFQMLIPVVNEDTYTATINYLATILNG